MPSVDEFPLWPDNPTAEDLLGFGDVAAPIVEALKRDRLDPVALGVFGDWGSGKTTVLELVKASLEGDKSIVVVYTQPWEYDPATDPKAVLIGEVLGAIRRRAEEAGGGKLSAGLKKRFKTLAKKVRWSKAVGLAARTAVSLTPPSFEDVENIFGKGEEADQEPTLQGFRDEFKDLMGELASISRVVVLVDDLDRCLPQTVIGALEAIKLFLSVPKMGFVIAADERLVEHAIATEYQGASQPGRMASQYLEKIVQIPLRVPALGESDTEAYLALLLLHRHLSDSDDFATVVEYVSDQRRKSAKRVLEGLSVESFSEEAREELGIAAQLAPVLGEEVEGNPRRLKRFLNAYWLRADIAKRRDAYLEPLVMAKLLLLERLDDDGFRLLLSWLARGELPDRLKKIEKTENRDDLEAEEQNLHTWANSGPPLAGKELGPYLRLAASLKSVAGSHEGLRSELRELLSQLAGDESGPRKAAVEQVEKLPGEDQATLARELVRLMTADPDRQSDVATAFAELRGSDAFTKEAMGQLSGFDSRLVNVDLVVRISDVPGGKEVIDNWTASGGLSELAAKAAEQQR